MSNEIKSKKKIKKNIIQGVAHVYASMNNTIVTITDSAGSAISWSSSGSKGFKGAKKGTAFAAQIATEDACRKAKEHGIKNLEVLIRGPGSGRESSLRAIVSSGIRITVIKDVTAVPHNGCRARKSRRI